MKNYTLRNAKTVAKFAEKLGQWNGKKLAIELVKLGAQKVTVEFIGGLYLKVISKEVSAEEVKAIVSKYADRVKLTNKELDRVAVSFADYLSQATFSDMFETPDFSALNDIQSISVIITNHMYTTLLSTLWTKSLDFRQSELLREEGFIFAAQLEALAQTEEATKETAQAEEAETIFTSEKDKYHALLTIMCETIRYTEMHVNSDNRWSFSAPDLNADKVTEKVEDITFGRADEVKLAELVSGSVDFIKEELANYTSKLTLKEVLCREDRDQLLALAFYPILETLVDDIAPSISAADFDNLYNMVRFSSSDHLLPQADRIAEALA